jgi:hypothetical protein
MRVSAAVYQATVPCFLLWRNLGAGTPSRVSERHAVGMQTPHLQERESEKRISTEQERELDSELLGAVHGRGRSDGEGGHRARCLTRLSIPAARVPPMNGGQSSRRSGG